VGGATVRDDDPRLTVRRATGPNPLRVVIDPRLELGGEARVFNDAAARTVVVCTQQGFARRGATPGGAEAMVVAVDENGRVVLAEILAALARRGCRSVFVEGGGITVTRFLEAGLLDRLQVAVAPFFIGEGRRGISLPGTPALADCPRPRHRMFRMGADLLFDLDLREPPVNASSSADADTAPVRIA
jgi:riboflavin-specific deaminase-like protein